MKLKVNELEWRTEERNKPSVMFVEPMANKLIYALFRNGEKVGVGEADNCAEMRGLQIAYKVPEVWVETGCPATEMMQACEKYGWHSVKFSWASQGVMRVIEKVCGWESTRSEESSPAKSDCPMWEKFLEETQDAAGRKLLQEIFGYCLIPGLNYHNAFHFCGEAATGKSVCARVLNELVGEDQVWRLSGLQGLESRRQRAELIGRKVYLFDGFSSHDMQSPGMGVVKSIVAGEPVSVDFKCGNEEMYYPEGRFVFVGNEYPHPDALEQYLELFRFPRMIWVKFSRPVSHDQQNWGLSEILKAELPGIFRWAVSGYDRLRRRGKFEGGV